MILDEIVSIVKCGIRKTIDISVDGDRLFFCNGILTHNSASGDTNDVTEENIQGGISKIQSADNVIAFVPNQHARESGFLTAKLLKTRDSGGVGSTVQFKIDWSTLTFEPDEKDETKSVMPDTKTYSKSESGKTTYNNNQKPDLRRNSSKVSLATTQPNNPPASTEQRASAADVEHDDSTDSTRRPVEKCGTSLVISSVKGKNSPRMGGKNFKAV
jgi:hypothetical protein